MTTELASWPWWVTRIGGAVALLLWLAVPAIGSAWLIIGALAVTVGTAYVFVFWPALEDGEPETPDMDVDLETGHGN